MSSLAILTGTSPREVGGSVALSRLDYQICWGACRIIELFKLGHQFKVGFEFHDDIIQVDGDAPNETIRFFQVKTRKTKRWTLGEIIKVDGDGSILGKLAGNFSIVGQRCSGLSLVCNTGFSFCQDDSVAEKLDKIHPKHREKIVNSIRAEINRIPDQALSLIEFCVSHLPLEEPEIVLRGRIAELVEHCFPHLQYNPSSFARLFIDECRRKAKSITSGIESRDQILATKFISRIDVDGWLSDLRAASSYRPKLTDAAIVCSADQFRRVRQKWSAYELARMDPTNLSMEVATEAARKALRESVPRESQSHSEQIALLVEFVVSEFTPIGMPLSQDIILTSVVYEYLSIGVPDEENRELPETDPEHENQEQ